MHGRRAVSQTLFIYLDILSDRDGGVVNEDGICRGHVVVARPVAGKVTSRLNSGFGELPS